MPFQVSVYKMSCLEYVSLFKQMDNIYQVVIYACYSSCHQVGNPTHNNLFQMCKLCLRISTMACFLKATQPCNFHSLQNIRKYILQLAYKLQLRLELIIMMEMKRNNKVHFFRFLLTLADMYTNNFEFFFLTIVMHFKMLSDDEKIINIA